MYDDLDYRVDGHLGIITLARPEVRNALRRQTYRELQQVVETADVRCLVVTGADPAFCSGDDVREIMSGGDGSPDVDLDSPRLTPAAGALLHSDIPVIAAVNGPAVGWGMELALMADLRIASERAKFGELFVRRGLCCDVAGLARLAQLVGREKATELLLTGEVVDAAEAHRIGLVGRVSPHDDLMQDAVELGGRIAENPPLAVRRLKAGLRQALDPDWTVLGEWVSGSLAELFRTEDHREGVRSFLESRQPRFVGR